MSVTLAVSYVSLVFGELVPKRRVMARPAEVALFAAPVLDRVGRVLRPVTWLLMASVMPSSGSWEWTRMRGPGE